MISAFYQKIKDILQTEKRCILMVVIANEGSSPGRKGFKMAVSKNRMFGTIGGGIMEHKFVELAKHYLRNNYDKIIIKRQVHNKSEMQHQSGMICSGEQTNLLFPINHSHELEVQKILTAIEENKAGSLVINNQSISFNQEVITTPNFYSKISADNTFEYKENIGCKNHIFIIGGGHCSLALAHIMHTLGFYIHLIDSRE